VTPFLPSCFNGDPSGERAERGQGPGTLKNTPCPRPFSGAGRGVGLGARVFRGPGRPVTNTLDAIPAIAAAMNCTLHESLGISPYYPLYGRPWKIFNPVQRSASKVAAVDDILNAPEATRMEVEMARKHATFPQTVRGDKHHKPLTEPLKNGSRVLGRGRPYTSSPGRSKKLKRHWFGPCKVLEHLPDTDNYKLHLPPRIPRNPTPIFPPSNNTERMIPTDLRPAEWTNQHRA